MGVIRLARKKYVFTILPEKESTST